MRLDTAAFDFAAMKVSLTWRGFTDVADNDAPEVLAIFILREPLAEPVSAGQAHEAYLDAITPEPPVVESPDEPAPPEPPPAPDPEAARREAEEAA
jgi:hypothetical protein